MDSQCWRFSCCSTVSRWRRLSRGDGAGGPHSSCLPASLCSRVALYFLWLTSSLLRRQASTHCSRCWERTRDGDRNRPGPRVNCLPSSFDPTHRTELIHCTPNTAALTFLVFLPHRLPKLPNLPSALKVQSDHAPHRHRLTPA